MGICFSVGIPCDRCLGFTARNAGYVWESESNLRKLEDANWRLFELMNDVVNRVHIEEQRGPTKRLENVEQWFQGVIAAEDEVNAILEDSFQQTRNLCLAGFCSKDFLSSYKFGKRVERQFLVMADLKEIGANFKEVVARLPDDPVEEMPIEQGVLSTEVVERLPDDPVEERPVDILRKEVIERLPDDTVEESPGHSVLVGRESLCDLIWACLADNQVGIIGLIGRGGVGKTALLRQINNTLHRDRRGFDLVIWVDRLTYRPVERIQRTIAERIGFYNKSWENEENAFFGATRIFNILENKKFVLLLDEVWEPIELLKAGVPLNNATSKIVFTTRSKEVCYKMGAHLPIEVKILGREQAWEVFCSEVGKETLDSHPDIPRLAIAAAEACFGLPLALKTVASAMSDLKSPQEWEDSIKILNIKGEKDPYQVMKISYDNLVGENIRSCFLYCSLFPRDYKISKRDLIDYWIGEDLLEVSREARDKGYRIIGVLRGACLLEEDEDGDHVSLHDVTRDMALWIAREKDEHERFFVAADVGLNQIPETKRWERAQRMSVMQNQIENLSQTPFSPHLLTLFLNSNNLQKISGGFFQSMPSLKVLNLSNNPLTLLPQEIAKLVSLEHLDLSRTNIQELSNNLKALGKIKCLNLENTSQLHTIPKGLISSFSMLLVLRMLNCGSNKPRKNSLLFDNGITLISELRHLKRLEMLSINLTNLETLQMFVWSQQLQKSTQSLCLQSIHGLKSLKVAEEGLERLDTLHMSGCSDLEEFHIDRLVRFGIYNLKEVSIEYCQKLKDLTWLILALHLKRLNVSNCSNMVAIINVAKLGKFMNEAGGGQTPFRKLEYLELQHLPKLESVHTEDLIFEKLKKIEVVQCSRLKKLPLDFRHAQERAFVIRGQREWWDGLIWEDPAAKSALHHLFREAAAENC